MNDSLPTAIVLFDQLQSIVLTDEEAALRLLAEALEAAEAKGRREERIVIAETYDLVPKAPQRWDESHA